MAGVAAKQSQVLSWVHWFYRDTMLQALRFVIQGAGAKVDAVIRKNIVSLLLSMLGHDEVGSQEDGGAGGLFGWCLCFAFKNLAQLPPGR